MQGEIPDKYDKMQISPHLEEILHPEPFYG